MKKGMVFNIQRFCIHDGPGIRTTIFLKGCNLHCFWCHNPESLDPQPELQYFPDKCIACLKCVEVCPSKAHEVKNGKKIFDRSKCRLCFKCTELCYAEALVKCGRETGIDETVAECLKDKEFYEQSKGGVTASGGEPLLQVDFLTEVFKKLKKEKIHTAIETAGNVDFRVFEEILPFLDLIIMDVKAFDREIHKKGTGVENVRILENLKELTQKNVPFIIRIPIIRGVNDDLEDLKKIADMLKEMKNIQYVELLKFHTYAGGKYLSLGKEYKCDSIKEISPQDAEKIKQTLLKSTHKVVSRF